MNTLKVVLTDHWFDEIKSGRKTHEYREICLFWIARLKKVVVSLKHSPFPLKEPAFIEFQRAYRKNPERMTFKIKKIAELKNGLNTDLKTENPVYDIELGERIEHVWHTHNRK